jgi:DtxR family transcriptional regulator, Mn-dependent transcriptional regulator
VITETVQDYLKAIYELQSEHGRASTNALAERLGVTPASASLMVKRLAGEGLVAHERYRGVVLSPKGRRAALEMIRHHRLIERFLADTLSVPWDEVHAEAERWEHVLSEDVEQRMDAALGFPTNDPHGSPIPAEDGKLPDAPRLRLSELESSEEAVVAEVSDEEPEFLRYVGGLGLYPGATVKIVEAAPFEGPLTVRVDNHAEHALGREAAHRIRVRDVRRAA